MSQRRPYYPDDQEETSLVTYQEPEPQPDYYYDEPYDESTGRTGVRGEEKDIDYSIYATRKDSVKYRNPDRDRCRKLLFALCVILCCVLIIAALIFGIILVLRNRAENADYRSTFAPTGSSSPTYNPISPPTFPPTIDTRPTGSPKPTTTNRPSEIPSANPTTSSPTTSSQPTADAELLQTLGQQDNGAEMNAFAQFGAQSAFDVNDDGLYEFVFQFHHLENLPVGPDNYEGFCADAEETKIADYDEQPYRAPRRFFQRLPDYVWNATGFQHISLDWYPCGSFPRNYAHAHYDISFFRVSPEDRIVRMACAEQTPNQHADIITACDFTQNTASGMEFYILPSSVADRSRVPNLPVSFDQADFFAAKPYDGMQYYDNQNMPTAPGDWKSLDMSMTTHGGDIMSWKARVPYRLISGPNPQFNSMTQEYYQPTISTLPDAFSVYYQQDGTIKFQMTGISAISKAEVERQQSLNPGDIPSAPTPLPFDPVCLCNPPIPSPSPSSVPSLEPSQSPTIPRFATCNLFTGQEATLNVEIPCFSVDYECNKRAVKDCQVECGTSQCLSSSFEQSYVICIDETSCNKIASTQPVNRFTNSQVICQVAGSCFDAEFIGPCTCCDGGGCPTENFSGNPLPSCDTTDTTAITDFCNQVDSSGMTCRELGNPVCTNL